MIPRYSRPAMAALWSDAHRLQGWLAVELAVTAVREKRGEVPAGVTERLGRNVRLSAERMEAIEAEVRHDVIAFLSMVGETGGDDARHLHVGMTSSDLVDTALALQIHDAGALLVAGVQALRRAVWDLAQRHRDTPMAGRTHGVHAEPITFGLKCLGWSEQLGRDLARLDQALAGLAVGKFSGAVGTLAHLSPEVEVAALGRLGLRPEPVATQVVARDRHAALLSTLALLGTALERMALEIRHLQRTEVSEVEEPFAAGQKGSSSMPHKRNPVRCERVCGLVRLLRSYAQAGLEDVALWHERDISHSSVERVVLADAFLLADYLVDEMLGVVSGLVVHAERMRANLDGSGGLVFSQRVLLALVGRGLSRDEAYRVVQGHALQALDGGGSFRQMLEADPRVTAALDAGALAACFDLRPYLSHLGDIFARAESPVR